MQSLQIFHTLQAIDPPEIVELIAGAEHEYVLAEEERQKIGAV